MSATRTSKFLSLVLRHDPARVGVRLDDAGWIDVATLLAACAAHGVVITADELDRIVRTSDKQRFALSDDGARIRANQGHSIDVELGLADAVPPARLYHGTVAAAVDAIRVEGLRKRGRHAVHLSADPETATRVGGRRGQPIVLTIRAAELAATGHAFQRSANGVWLTDHVPPAFLDVPAPRDRAPRERARGGGGDRAAIARATVAACDAGGYTTDAGTRVELADLIAAARAGTELHELGVTGLRAPMRTATTSITVTGESTFEALARLDGQPGGHLACLNFASAKNPGGGFLGGAQAQEEMLARASALVTCQRAQPAFYARNRANRSVLYLDLALWSPQVPFFRDDRGGWLERPVRASVITAPAPNASALRQQRTYDRDAVEQALRRRAGFVLAIAAHHRVARLVLGAWGAGVFGNDPAMVADAFAVHLDGFAGAFAEVVFAVLGGPGKPNHDAFAARFAAG